MRCDPHRTWLVSSVDEALRAVASGSGVQGVRLSSEYGGQGRVRDGWVKKPRARLKPSGSLSTKKLKYCTLQTLFSAFRALLHSGFSVTKTSQSQLLMFSSISVNNVTCWWLVTCWSPVGHYAFGVLNDIFQVNTSTLQLGLQLNQSPVTTLSLAETCYVLSVALTKCKYLLLLLFLVIHSQGSRSRSLSRMFSVDIFY